MLNIKLFGIFRMSFKSIANIFVVGGIRRKINVFLVKSTPHKV